MKKSLILSISAAFAIIAIIVVLISFFTDKKENVSTENPFEEVERTKNLLQNGSFENPLSLNDWQIKVGANSNYGFDRFSVKHNEFSLAVQHDATDSIKLFQRVDNLYQNKKYIFFGFVKSEEFDSISFSLEVYDANDSLLFSGYSAILKNTFDWTMASTWIRTQEKSCAYLIMKVVAAGKGKVWFDYFNLYAMPIDYKFNQINFEKIF